MADYRDAVIEALADSEAALGHRIRKLTSERDAYRLIACQAIYHCHAQRNELTRLRGIHERLINEFRAFREKTAACKLEVA